MSCLNFWLSSELRKSKKRLSLFDNDGDNDNVAGALPLPVLSQSLTAAAAAPAQPPTLPDAHAHTCPMHKWAVLWLLKGDSGLWQNPTSVQ